MVQDCVGHNRTARVTAMALALLLVSGCEEGTEGLSFLQPTPDEVTETVAEAPPATRLVERDVEAPEVFQVTEAGLWDGRPSLGGVWVAHPDVDEPERVIIRNSANGKFVIGALFRRERDIPGPRLQTSSDAAAALGMLAGAPVELNVTALRREEVPDASQSEDVEDVDAATTQESPEPPVDPITEAGAALDEETVAAATAASTVGSTPPVARPSDGTIETAALDALETAPAAAPSPAPEPTSVPSPLRKPFLQIGIFSVEENANRAADTLRTAGIVPTIDVQSTNGKPSWRVLVGPARSTSERRALLRKINEVGFSDAYAVSN